MVGWTLARLFVEVSDVVVLKELAPDPPAEALARLFWYMLE